MKIIEQSAELWRQEFPTVTTDFQDTYLTLMFKHIERCGKVSYKSENTITDDSYKRFIKTIIENKHYSVLEHGTIYLRTKDDEVGDRYFLDSYSYVGRDSEDYLYITTNYRVIIENGWEYDLKYLCNPTVHHTYRNTVHCITSIGISREANRSRSFSITEQSTRYCNYSKDKFNNEITFIKPYWILSIKPEKTDQFQRIWFNNCYGAEQHYLRLIQKGYKPQEAREILPLSTATEVVYTAGEFAWQHFFNLRLYGTTGTPHPDMQNLAQKIKNCLEQDGKDFITE